MSTKSVLAIAGLAIVLTPVAISAIDAASARQPAIAPTPTPVAMLRADLEASRTLAPQTCGPAVRVVAGGYGEPVGRRCAPRRPGSP